MGNKTILRDKTYYFRKVDVPNLHLTYGEYFQSKVQKLIDTKPNTWVAVQRAGNWLMVWNHV